jgi:hypothetical protein
MAGDWIKMRVDLATDPAVADIGIALNIGEDLVVGKLHRFWAWVTAHFAEAKLKPDSSATRAWIDRHVGLTGFVDAMLTVGWMTVDGGYLSITKYDRHMSEGAKTRALRMEQQKARRLSKREAIVKPSNGLKQASREEKRREDKEIYKEGPSFAEFWTSYPRRERKKESLKCWSARLAEGVSEASLISAARNYASECAREKKARQHILQPTTFLGPNLRFQDFVQAAESDSNGRPAPRVSGSAWIVRAGKYVCDMTDAEKNEFKIPVGTD